MKIYLDSCCYSRPYDTHAQERTNRETVAIVSVVEMCKIMGYPIIGSFAVVMELGSIRRDDKRKNVLGYYGYSVSEYISINTDIEVRAQSLQTMGLKKMDSFHLACAEATRADFLMTTDVRFENAYKRLNFSFVKVLNPLNFFSEVISER